MGHYTIVRIAVAYLWGLFPQRLSGHIQGKYSLCNILCTTIGVCMVIRKVVRIQHDLPLTLVEYY